MDTLKYLALFALIQVASLVLTLVGIPLCAVLAYGNFSNERTAVDVFHFPAWAWLWDNEEDGTIPRWYANQHLTWSLARVEFYWTALRNPCNNLRFVPGVSLKGRPLWRREWTMLGRPYYVQAGWNGSGYPVLSGGINIHA